MSEASAFDTSAGVTRLDSPLREQPGDRREGNRRVRAERRSRSTPIFSRYTFFGRRRGGRRDDEAVNVYVDRFAKREWLLVAGIFVLSMLDLVFTLIHLDAGGREANPVMDWFLQAGGTDAFSVAKFLFTIIGLLVLLVHAKFDRVKLLLAFAFSVYGLLFVFHIYVMYVRIA